MAVSTLEKIKTMIRDVPDFPKPGIVFKDITPLQKIQVSAKSPDGKTKTFTCIARVDTPNEIEYFKNGGILPYVLRQALTR